MFAALSLKSALCLSPEVNKRNKTIGTKRPLSCGSLILTKQSLLLMIIGRCWQNQGHESVRVFLAVDAGFLQRQPNSIKQVLPLPEHAFPGRTSA